MRKTTILYLLFIAVANCFAQNDPTQYVNPFTGTQDMGHTFPGATVPFGMVQLSPDTDTIMFYQNGEYNKDVYRYCAGYQYEDSTIVGFSHTHFNGTGHSDLGDFLIMPFKGEPKFNPGTSQKPDKGYRSRYRKTTEAGTPGYYTVELDDYKVKAELTATTHVGIHQYTFEPRAKRKILLDLFHGIYNYDGKIVWSSIRLENDTLITGYRQTQGWARDRKLYFAMSFSEKIMDYRLVNQETEAYKGFWRKFDKIERLPECSGKKLKAWFQFKPAIKPIHLSPKDLRTGKEPPPRIGPPLKVKVAISAVSTKGAIKNLQEEAPHWNFEAYKEEAREKWNQELKKISITATEKVKSNFYTAMYHAFMSPVVYEDVDGQYRGLDQRIHQSEGFTNYTIFSLWDTFRALHPLLTIMQPQRTSDMVNSMLAHQQQSVHDMLPIWSHYSNENWCMTGYHAASVISDAIVKNIPGIDIDTALHAMKRTAWYPKYNQNQIYRIRGYVPYDDGPYSVTKTLEYSYDDWAIFQVAQLAKQEKLARALRVRADNYKNMFDQETGLMRPKMHDKTWVKDFDPLATHGMGFIEGNAYTYSLFVPHDIMGLAFLKGGNEALANHLDTLFTMPLPEEKYADTEDITSAGIIGNYIHGNEPGHHVPYMYNYVGRPWKTEHIVRRINKEMYRATPDGLCGNDDCGQMSAWYIFSALGFYPVTPGTNQYVLGSPNIEKAKINLKNGKTFEIEVKNQSPANIYVQKVLLNGKEWPKLFITHQMIIEGGKLTFFMSDRPNKNRGQQYGDRPYSLSAMH
ncbi:MAG TPA: GH92 family glycosyl hydrolase [Salinivirga sp.]|uniref:GH92 family glycosyl hydrolase n=1 Tax=Salinivirga sp. TaxID=1970192 RepID=UPI002B4880FA|nr:GH92 family glycosyl hydrolase [Salinivirga sp.]HKK60715.1 GH92 family glycosyl hydrolase [Salinivirga sp.]